jgi:chorismate mutase
MTHGTQTIRIPSAPSWFSQPGEISLIAGPCSAETEEQVFATAIEVKKIPQLRFFRAGVWKPRTRPGTFSGSGDQALAWIARVKKELSLPTMVEVATARHVELALASGVDALWVGARTVVNPFSVQEIADALRGTDLPVFIKNPIVPDLGLWLGAIERIFSSGISKIAAIHRGFATYSETRLRYSPEWKIPADLVAALPGLPLICDPSHITGHRDLIEPMAEEALSHGVDGLMIETHVSPDAAWSDSKQQVSPAALLAMINRLEKSRLGANGNKELYLETLQARLRLLNQRSEDLRSAQDDTRSEILRVETNLVGANATDSDQNRLKNNNHIQ